MSWVRVLVSPQMLLLHLLAVAAIGMAGWMGWWQLNAWQESREDRALDLVDEEPRPLTGVLGPDDPFPAADVGRPVVASGQWLPGTVYVAERRRSADAADDGVWQLAFFAVCPGGDASACPGASAVPVVLGWAPEPSDGVAPPTGTGQVTGWLQPAEQGRGDTDPSDEVVPSLRSVDLLQRTDRDVYSGYLILGQPAEARAGLVPVTPATLPEPPPSTALRNLLYGLEWWVFAGFALYLWWRWSRDAVAAAGQQEQEEQVASTV